MLYTMCTVLADNFICITKTITISISLVLVVLDQMTVEVGLFTTLEVTLFTLEGLIVGVLHLNVSLEQTQDIAGVLLPRLEALLAVVGGG